jgi:transcriptional regulator with XRE-family HTH domain
MPEQTLGTRIRSLRKQLGMTQADLAGTEVSKGMLSLIENDLTNPSIRILQHIAGKLGKPLSYFTDQPTDKSSVPTQEGRDQLMDLITRFDLMVESRMASAAEQLMAEIESLELLQHDRVLRADLDFKFGRFLYSASRFDEAESRLLRAEEQYLTLGLYTNAAEARLTTWIKYNHLLDFEKCQQAVNRAERIYTHAVNRDHLFEIRLYHTKARLITFRHTNLKEADDALDTAISLSTQSNMYYYAELFLAKARLGIEESEYAKFRTNADKALRFCEATRSDYLLVVLHTIAEGENKLGDSRQALEVLRRSETVEVPLHLKKLPTYGLVHAVEMGKAYYRLGGYEEARLAFESIDVADYDRKLFYMPERIYLWKEIVHYGLLLSRLGRHEDAAATVEASIRFLEGKKQESSLSFACKCLGEIHATKGNFELAYQYQQLALQVLERSQQEP